MDVPNCTVPKALAGNAAARQIMIASKSNFVIQLTPMTTKVLAEKVANVAPKRPRAVEFYVSREVLIEHSAFFRNLFRVQPDLSVISVEKKHISMGYALEVWLRAIHNGIDTIPANLKATHTERAWVAIAVGEQFRFAPSISKIKPWFVELYRNILDNGPGLTPMIAQSLLFPCRTFDHAEGFMKLTKYLVYNTNTTMFSNNLSPFGGLDMNARLLDGPLVAARATVQSVLDGELHYPLEKLHRAGCVCRKETAFDYEDALRALDCWPIHKAIHKYSLSEIIEELYKFNFLSKATNCMSGACRHDFKKSVNIAIEKANHHFSGLCLDCMTRSKHVDELSQEFIDKNSPYKGCWDMDCRYGHGKPSWYFSWMGPSSTRKYILDTYRQEKEQRTAVDRGDNRGGRGRARKHVALRESSSAIFNENSVPTGSCQFKVNFMNGNSEKENVRDNSGGTYDIEDDDDVFFDAEDANLDEAVANDALAREGMN